MSWAPGIKIKNDGPFPVLAVLSQVSPLYWSKILPGETKHIDCGRVWFTVTVEPFNENSVPTELGVATRIGTVVAMTLVNPFFGAFGAAVSGMTTMNHKNCDKKSGVLADGKTVVVHGKIVGDEKIAQIYELVSP